MKHNYIVFIVILFNVFACGKAKNETLLERWVDNIQHQLYILDLASPIKMDGIESNARESWWKPLF